MSYGFQTPPKRSNAVGKIAVAILGAALIVMAGLGARAVFFKDRPEAAVSAQESTAEVAGNPPTAVADSSGTASDPTASGDSPAALPSGGNREGEYTQSLMNDPNVTLRDPERLVTLGRSTCRYWDSVYDGWTPQKKYQRAVDFLTMRNVSPADADSIISSAVRYLCPQNQYKLEGR